MRRFHKRKQDVSSARPSKGRRHHVRHVGDDDDADIGGDDGWMVGAADGVKAS